MKQIKITIILVVLMSMTGLNVSAQRLIDGIYYNLDGTMLEATVTSGTNKYTGAVVIPSSVTYNSKTYIVTSIGGSAFSDCSGLTSITIPNSVTSIGSYAFYGCTKLSSVTIPNSVTSIGHWAFESCSGLTSVTIPNSVTSIGNYAFRGCSSLSSVSILKEAPINITSDVFTNRTNATLLVPEGSKAAYKAAYYWKEFKFIKEILPPLPSSPAIVFADENVKTLCLVFWDRNEDGELSENEAAAVKDLEDIFKGNTSITSFKELSYFTGLTSIGSSAFENCSGLTSVTIPNNVTSIGTSAFSGCSGLVDVTLNSNSIASKTYTTSYNMNRVFGTQVTKYKIGDGVKKIGDYTFYDCIKLTSVTIPNSVTSIGAAAFYGCTGLTKVIINDIAAWCNISFVSENSNPLSKAHHLYSEEYAEIKDLMIPEGVTSIGASAFSGCSGLSSVSIPNSVTSIGNSAFSGCSGLTSVSIPNSVTIVGESSFQKCYKLISVSIPNSVTSIGQSAFSSCSNLNSITIPNSVTSIGNSAFSGCSGLISVTMNSDAIASKTYTSSNNMKSIFGEQVKEYLIGETVTSIGDNAFYECSRLASVSVPNSLTSIGQNSFKNCSGLKKVIVSDIAAWCGISFGNIDANPLYYAKHPNSDENTEIKDLIIPNSVTSIGHLAFYGCTGLTSVTIPNSVKSIGNSAFRGCSGLTSITIPNSVTSIGNYAFGGCYALNKVIVSDIAAWCGISFGSGYANPLYYAKHLYSDENAEITDLVIPEGVTIIGNYAFEYCSSLASVTIPNSVTSIGSNAFYSCTALPSVTIPNSVMIIGSYAFYNCTALPSVTIPNSVTSIGDYAFSGCSGLTSVTIPNSVTSFGAYAFEGCSALNKVIVSDIAAWCGISFGNRDSNPLTYAKHLYSDENTEITNIVIPNSVTSIGVYSFYRCSGLTSITIPNSVTSLGESAFAECSNIASVTMLRETPISNLSNVFSNLTKAILWVPEGSKAAYKTADYWKGFKYIREILPPLPPSPAIVFADENVKTLCLVLWDRDEDGELSENEAAAVNDLEDIFKGNTSITSFNELSYFIALTSIGSSAFYGCTSLTSITIPYNVSGISDSAFYGCTSLTSVTIPNSVTSIGNSAFRGLTGLKSIVIPASVESIGNYAFSGCNKLLDVVTLITSPVSIPDNAFSSKTYADGSLYVPKGTKSKYKVRGGWKNFVYMEEGVPAGIDNIANEGAKEAARYTLDGKRVATPQPGLNIVRMTDGSTRKVVVK